MNSCFLSLPFKYLTWVRTYNRCPLLTLPFICMHVVVAGVVGGSLYILAGHSSAVELQMRSKGGLAGMAASSICITCVSGGCSLTYRPSVSFISTHGYLSLNLKTLWDHTHKGHARLLQSPSESITNPQAF